MRRYEAADAPAVDRLNRRLEAADSEHRLWKEDLTQNPTADLEIRPVNDSLFVAVDGDEIRGGTWLREQYVFVEGSTHSVGWMKYPVAESVIEPQFAGVPASMVLQLLRRQRHLLALGMGGHAAPLARLLAGIGWECSTIPFFFRIVNPFRVLRGLEYLRGRTWPRVAMDLAAWSGVAWGLNWLSRASSYRAAHSPVVSATTEPSFVPWADAIWEDCRGAYPVQAVRDARTLDHVYRPSFPDLHRLRIARGSTNIGWAVTRILPSTQENARYFGRLRVGLVTDVLALPTDAPPVLAMGVRHLESLDVDLVITYLSHAVWIDAARRLRFLRGPSNFAFYAAQEAAELFLDGADLASRCHFTRHTFGEDDLVAA